MHEYDLYVPLCPDKGGRVSTAKLNRLKKLLIKRFGGLTQFSQKQHGFWRVGKVTFRDDIVIWRALSGEPGPTTQKFWDAVKAELARDWGQKEVLVVRKAVNVI